MINCPRCNILFDENGKWGKRKYCSRTCANSRGPRTQEEKDAISAGMASSEKHASSVVARKGINKSVHISKTCPVCSVIFNVRPSENRAIYCSKQCYKEDSLHLYRKSTPGGYREGSGKSKSGYYKGIYCGSTYELCWVIYRLDHQLPVKRFNGYILYDDNRKYYPDFIDGTHIFEMKGWLCKKTDPEVHAKSLAAINQGYTIDVLFKEDLTREFNWVKEKYNTSKYYTLYDTYKPTFIYNCNHCGCEVAKDKKAKTDKVFCSRVCAGKGHTGRVQH